MTQLYLYNQAGMKKRVEKTEIFYFILILLFYQILYVNYMI